MGTHGIDWNPRAGDQRRRRIVGVVGPPGIGKSRIASELSAIAAHRGVEVFTTYCEAHAGDIPFHAVARLLRAVFGVTGTDPETARARVRARLDTAAPDDLLLLDDLLGIRDPARLLPRSTQTRGDDASPA